MITNTAILDYCFTDVDAFRLEHHRDLNITLFDPPTLESVGFYWKRFKNSIRHEEEAALSINFKLPRGKQYLPYYSVTNQNVVMFFFQIYFHKIKIDFDTSAICLKYLKLVKK